MSGVCERCNERNSYILNITRMPELEPVAHLGYRLVCSACYDDLLAEANEVEEQDEDRRAEERVEVAIKAVVEGNTSTLEPFSEEMTIKQLSPSGLRLQTARDIEPGTVVKIKVVSHNIEATAIAEAAGFAQWLHARGEISTTGDVAASRLGQVSWAMFEWARNPYILVVWIYLFAPYFAKYVVPAGYCGAGMTRGACGQGIAGVIQAYSGIFIAILAPFLGAIADRGGRRKPWRRWPPGTSW